MLDASHSAIQLLGKAITGVSFERVTICGAGAGAVQVQAPGRAIFRDVVAGGLGGVGVVSDGSTFELVDAGGNLGWPGRETLAVPQVARPVRLPAGCVGSVPLHHSTDGSGGRPSFL